MAAPQLTGFVGTYIVTVHGDQYNTFEQTCDTAAQLRAFVGIPGLQVFVRGINAPGDGGAGSFWWNEESIASDDGLNCLVPPPPFGGPGGWNRLTASNGGSFTVTYSQTDPIGTSGIAISDTTRLTSDGNSPDSTNTLNFPANSAIAVSCTIVAYSSSGGGIGWTIEFGAQQGSTPNTTAIIGTPSWTQTFANGTSASDISMSAPTADTDLGAINLTIIPSFGEWIVGGTCSITGTIKAI